MTLDFCLCAIRRTGDLDALYMAELTLEKMAHGGIYDQLGGGFHRYSVDAVWLVPHFEKMLYDNAQLLRTYLHAWQVTQRPAFPARRGRDDRLCAARDDRAGRRLLQHAGCRQRRARGQILCVDAAEIEALLDPHTAAILATISGVSARGNFEGKNILSVVRSVEQVARAFRISEAPSRR
jgi:uncharacterized protein YyaL (SSP411 family)